jgi:hypothetical protein
MINLPVLDTITHHAELRRIGKKDSLLDSMSNGLPRCCAKPIRHRVYDHAGHRAGEHSLE